MTRTPLGKAYILSPLSLGDKHEGDEHHMIRRTITVDDTVNQMVNHIRATLLEKNMELDFTTAINLFAEYGIRCFLNSTSERHDDLEYVLKKYTDNDNLKMAVIGDQVQDLVMTQILKLSTK